MMLCIDFTIFDEERVKQVCKNKSQKDSYDIFYSHEYNFLGMKLSHEVQE